MPDFLPSRSQAAIRLWPLAALRIYAGVFFAYHGLGKLNRGNFADGMSGFLSANIDASFGFYRPFIETVVLPNHGVFAALVAFGELALGIALILGLATRYAAFTGAFMVANFWFAKGAPLLGGQNQDVVWLVVLLVLGLVPAGRVFGLDDGLADRLRFLR